MSDVNTIKEEGNGFNMNTGSPHLIVFKLQDEIVDTFQEGKAIRYSEKYKKEGINVNFVKEINTGIEVSTYERGVEDETYSCGTGTVASALAAYKRYNLPSPIQAKTKGGKLTVHFENKNLDNFENIWLQGPAIATFKGSYIF